MDRLARNAMLARQAGMSYGKWKAMQPVVETKKPEIPEGHIKCECGAFFKTRCDHQLCPDCRKKKYDRERKRKRADYMRRYREEKKHEQAENVGD